MAARTRALPLVKSELQQLCHILKIEVVAFFLISLVIGALLVLIPSWFLFFLIISCYPRLSSPPR